MKLLLEVLTIDKSKNNRNFHQNASMPALILEVEQTVEEFLWVYGLYADKFFQNDESDKFLKGVRMVRREKIKEKQIIRQEKEEMEM